MFLHCCYVTFRIPKQVCCGLLPFEVSLTLNSYLICLICSPFPACLAHFPTSIFYFVEVIILASFNLYIPLPIFNSQLITTSSVMIFCISSLGLNFFFLILSVVLSMHHLHVILLQVLWSRDVIYVPNMNMTIFSRPNVETLGHIIFSQFVFLKIYTF